MAQQQDNKEKMISIAIDLFAERGFRGTSIRDIANAMGMSINNIYHYFGSKEGLLLAIIDTSSKNLLEQLGRALAEESDPLARFECLLKAHIRISAMWKKEAKVFLLEEEHLSPEGNKASLKYQREVTDIYRNQLQILKDSGYVKIKNVTVQAFNILGVINWNLRWYNPDGPLTLEEVCQETVDFVLHGICGSEEQEME